MARIRNRSIVLLKSFDCFGAWPVTAFFRASEIDTVNRHGAPRDYEVDYLITPALGGADDIRNLWPESYGAVVWNARVKDALEDRMRELVCSGQLDLATAQREIASDWIGSYKKYFHTERPLAVEASNR